MEADPKKVVTVYAPDQHSQGLDRFERYVLGKAVKQVRYEKILFSREPVAYHSYLYAPSAMVRMKKGGVEVGKGGEGVGGGVRFYYSNHCLFNRFMIVSYWILS